MTMTFFKKPRLVLALSFFAVATTDRAAHAQDDGAPGRDQAAIGAQQLLELEFQIERADRQLDRQGLRDRFESILKSRVDKLDHLYQLSGSQQKKLRLAGRVDIDRHFAKVEELEHRLSLVRADADAYSKVLEEISVLQRVKGQDLFGMGSLFSKVFGNTLTKEQTTRYRAVEQQTAKVHHQAALKWVLSTWDQTLKLSDEQHRRLDVLLAQATRPPRRFGEEDYVGLLLQLSRLPEGKLKSIFREEQWASLAPQLAEARRREPKLTRDGYVPEEDVAVGLPAARPGTTEAEKKQG
jgi:hypothetical protein